MTDPCPAVVVVGSANVDLVARVGALPRPGETVAARSYDRAPGGKGANQAVAAARAGASVAFVGCVGPDSDGDLVERALTGEGIQTRLLRSRLPTGTAFITVDDTGENQIVVVQGANAEADSSCVEGVWDLVQNASVVLTQLEIAESALAAIRSIGTRTVLNPAPARSMRPEDLQVDLCVPNASELAVLVGGPVPANPAEAVEAASRLVGPASVVVTLGAAGAVVVDSRFRAHVAAPEVGSPVDTTGAGDTFCGYLTAAIAEGATLLEATRYGVFAASFSVCRPGTIPAIPHRRQVEAVLADQQVRT